jgi:tetratricopeptide (TPR) repeat protein
MFFILNIFLVLQLLPVGDAFMAERYAYVPSIGYFFIIAFLIGTLAVKWKKSSRIIYMLFTIYAAVLLFLSYQRIWVWYDGWNLWENIYAKSPHPNNSKALVVRAHMLHAYGHNTNAMEEINLYVKHNPEKKGGWILRASIYEDIDQHEEAIKDLLKAKKIDPEDPLIFTNLGKNLMDLGYYDEALQNINIALELDSNYVDALNGRANIHLIHNRYSDALKDLDKSIELKPSDPEVYNNRGFVKNQLKDKHGAVKDYTKAIGLDPDLIKAYENRALLYLDLENFQNAVGDLNVILTHKQVAKAYYLRGKAYVQLGNRDAACKDLKKARSLGVLVVEQDFLEYCDL